MIEATGGLYAAGIGGGGSDGSPTQCGIVAVGAGVTRVIVKAGALCANAIGAGTDGRCIAVAVDASLNDSTDGAVRTIAAKSMDLSTLAVDDMTFIDGTVITGVFNRRSTGLCIAPGATVTLRDARIDNYYGLKCLGDATIILEGENYVRSEDDMWAAISVPTNYVLTITGSGSLVARGESASGIGSGYGVPCGAIEIRGGTITASGGKLGSGIGSGRYDPDLNKRGTCKGVYIYETVCCVTASTDGSNPSISSVHSDATRVDRRFTTITENPFIYRGKGVNLSLLEEDYTARNGDIITGGAGRTVTIPAGATVTVNGVTVAGAAGGTVLPAPEFADGGDAMTIRFMQGENGKWTLTTFAEIANDALGADVADGQVKVYAADSIEGLKTASPMAGGVEIKEKKSAVKTTIEVTPPSGSQSRFFKVKFGK